MTTSPKVHAVTDADADKAIATLTLAFATDAVIRAFYPDPLDHLTHFREMMQINIAPAIAHRSAYYVEGFSAATIWFPPVDPDDDADAKERRRQLDALIERTASTEGNDDLFAAMGEMGKWHPSDPHWYLFSIGVDPHRQNEGLGSVLMEHALPKCDSNGIMSYLESSNPRNVPFYQRHGFDVLQVVQVGSSPTFTLMVREPR